MADLRIWRGGRIYTADAAGSWAEALAVREGRILAVGNNAEIEAAFPDAGVIDVGGRTVVPGFIDPHNHYVMTGESLAAVDVRYPGVASVEDLVAAVAAAAPEAAPGSWINGWGFDHGKYERTPTRWDLDRATTAHLVGIAHVSGHYLLVAGGEDESRRQATLARRCRQCLGTTR